MGDDAKRPVVLIAAVSTNRVIGRNGDMPWKLSTDLKRFKAMTLGNPVVVGRKTFESFGGRPLPGRPHVVVTRDPSCSAEGVETADSLARALERAQEIAVETNAREIAVIGGGEIYTQALPLADTLYLTHVDAVIEDGDTYFPVVDEQLFECVERETVPAGEKDNFSTVFAVYRRRPAAI
ncbi:dihydrofolate reductase [Rhizobium sp. FKY42]|uniref:dihydrofolate reductase n=1 Tax=Rhizobium sp. FKY42 TaxID=2562310 RepID=UPI0010C0CCC9|nr:dihydrofolate reductase [Rhizobium sp. FKY42]